MELAELQVFLTVASERSFSRAAAKLHRTQPAVSQAIRRLEDELGERLFDRSSKQGALTEAGRVLRDYAQRLMRLSEEAETAVRDLRDLRRGRVLIGANEGAVHALLPPRPNLVPTVEPPPFRPEPRAVTSPAPLRPVTAPRPMTTPEPVRAAPPRPVPPPRPSPTSAPVSAP